MRIFANNSKYAFYLLLLFLLSLVANNIHFDENFPLYFFHVLIAIISIIIVMRKDCAMMVQGAGVFFLVFFSLFPIYELSNEIIYWQGAAFTSEIRLFGAVISFIFVLLFWCALSIRFSFSTGFSLFIQKLFEIDEISTKKFRVLIFFSTIAFLLLFHFYSYHAQSLFVKGGEHSIDLNVDTKTAYIIIEFFLRPLIFNISLVCILFSPKSIFFKIFLILIMVFACSPSGVSRFLVAALYMPLVIIALMSQLSNKKIILSYYFYLYPSLLLLGLCMIFPILEIFRNFSFEKFSEFSYIHYQMSGSFDAFQLFLRALDVGQINYGYGFLGALLFFIPRSIWPSKPMTSSIEIAQLSDLSWVNVSMPIIGELYLNFWYFGIILGSPLIALLFKKIDSFYLRYKCSNLSLGHLVYFQLACLVVINFRGGFLSTFAYTVSILITWLLIAVILVEKGDYKD